MILINHYAMLQKLKKVDVGNGLQPLMDQQFWCWGQDVRADENYLMAAGFRRERGPKPAGGSTRYVRTEGSREVILWGFGGAVVDGEGWMLFLSRFGRVPAVGRLKSRREADFHRVVDLPRLVRPRTIKERDVTEQLWGVFRSFAEAYETWMSADQNRLAHRRASLLRWMNQPFCEADEISWYWSQVEITKKSGVK